MRDDIRDPYVEGTKRHLWGTLALLAALVAVFFFALWSMHARAQPGLDPECGTSCLISQTLERSERRQRELQQRRRDLMVRRPVREPVTVRRFGDGAIIRRGDRTIICRPFNGSLRCREE